MQVVALHDQVAAGRAAARQFRYRLQQAKRHILVVRDNGVFADPVECGRAGRARVAGGKKVDSDSNKAAALAVRVSLS